MNFENEIKLRRGVTPSPRVFFLRVGFSAAARLVDILASILGNRERLSVIDAQFSRFFVPRKEQRVPFSRPR